MEERRQDYIDLQSKMLLMEKDVSYIKEGLAGWIDSLKRHNASLMHLQGYEDRVDLKFSELKESIHSVREIIVKQNSRIGKLENWRWLIVGGLAVIAFIASIVLPIGAGILRDTRAQIIKHTGHPKYHETIATEIRWIKERLSDRSRGTPS